MSVSTRSSRSERSRTSLEDPTASLYTKLVNPRFFVEATRESGYKSTTHALAELVDNSLQAKATQIRVCFEDTPNNPTDIAVYTLDDGVGMDIDELALALQFGGSTRFGERDGIGRFGMGLPNASVSQCRRLEVYTWKAGGLFFTPILTSMRSHAGW